MMRLMFGQLRVRVGRVFHPGKRHQLARPHEHKVERHLPRDLDRVVVELFGSSSSPQYLSIFLVDASYAGRLW